MKVGKLRFVQIKSNGLLALMIGKQVSLPIQSEILALSTVNQPRTRAPFACVHL